ncbi:hypothetical protein [Teichococcus vastitatis]|uniref:Uncharacterized protein n=1 Tax=Teichococcus vastitatis TaxID=2307076 RepID=A0ABS9W2Z2_9PROT|nr:hypothetical protein [Pseudoroseomonas vastitatis]MCI0753661.1 hypothetical protein [Pseudoroseomonas vastitatis]
MTYSRTLFAAAALMGLAAGSALAEPLTVNSQGENFAVTYDRAYTGNVVGGGAVQVENRGQNLRIVHQDPNFTRHSAGIPVFEGGSEGNVVYLPQVDGHTNLAAR